MKTKAYLFLPILFGVTACSAADDQVLYANCVELGTQEQMEGWDESDRPSVKAGVEQGCKMIMQECEKDPDGAMCKAFKDKYGAK